METISQDGTNIEYEIFMDANIEFVNGHKLILHLTKEEYQSFNSGIENGNTRWHFLRKSKDGESYIINEWIFLNNSTRVSYSERLTFSERLTKNGIAII